MSEDNPGRDRIEIRPGVPSDAERLLDLKLTLDHETTFMMYEPGERKATVAGLWQEIDARAASPNSTLVVAVDRDMLAGYVEATGGEFNRTRHLAVVVAGVRAGYAGQGIGTQLFQALTTWADGVPLRRLELTVQVQNRAALGLYEKFGFAGEGVRRCSMVVDGRCVDELAMARVHAAFAGSEPNE